MHRPSLLRACLLAVALMSAAAASATQRPLIEQSHVLAPRHVADLTLQQSSYDPAKKAAGVGFRYRAATWPDARIDLYVYPAGSGVPARMLSQGLDDFRGSLRDAQRAGYFKELRIVEDAPFALEPQTGRESADPLAAVLRETETPAQRLVLQMRDSRDNGVTQSLGYLAYENLYWFKLRISDQARRADNADFLAFGDEVMRALMAGSEVLNIGGCYNSSVNVDTNLPAEQAAAQMLGQVRRINMDNCLDKPDAERLEQAMRDRERVIIDFSPRDWSQR